MPSELTQRLAQHFGAFLPHDPALLSETTSICTHYNVDPEELFFKWEAFAINNKLPKSEPLTIDHARELRKIIASSMNATEGVQSTPLKASSAMNRGKIVGGDLGAMLGVKGTPIKTPNANNSFQTPVRNASYGSNSPFGGPGATPATASAYKQPSSSILRDNDVAMPDIDSPSRLSIPTTPSTSSKATNPPFTILESLNENLPLTPSGSQLSSTATSTKKSRVSLAMATDPKAWNYRYMFEPKSERSLVLDDRIDDYASLLRTAYSIDESEEFGDPSLPSQEPIWVVGRICPALPAPASSAGEALKAKAAARSKGGEDESTAFGLPKLAETGVVLESSRMMGSGNRTPLVFNKGCIVRHTPTDPGTGGAATTLSLFPGQIVLLHGINAGADKFAVSQICFPPPLPLAVHTVEEALDHSYSPSKLNGTPLNLVAASGPFTEDSNLDFTSWHKLMDEMELGGLPTGPGEPTRRGVPDTLIFTGPFISASHPLLPFSSEMPAEIFARHFSTRLQTLLSKYPSTMVVLIPSTEDVLNVHSAYPQPGFGKEEAHGGMGLVRGRVRCLPNPSVFYVNELVIGVTSADSLGDIKSEEMVMRIEASPSGSTVVNGEAIAAKNKETNTRWSRAILSQRSFYPLYPPPTNTTAGLAYDTSHSHLLNFPAVTPDLLILPSTKLPKPFIRVVSSSTIVQPGSVAKASVVAIQIQPLEKRELEEKQEMETINSRLYDRARVDVVSIF